MTTDHPLPAALSDTEREQVRNDLHALVDRIDRRGPNADVECETAIAGDAARVRQHAETRLAKVEDTPRHDIP